MSRRGPGGDTGPAHGPMVRTVTRGTLRIAPDMEWEPVLGADALLSCHRTERRLVSDL